MSEAPSPRTKIRRNAARAEYDLNAVQQILDAEMVCTVAFVQDGEPRMIPTLHLRQGEYLYLHGNRQAAYLRHIADGGTVAVSVMLVDGVVVARSGFHCSMNYRSVTLYGQGELVAAEEHEAILAAFVNGLIPGHNDAVREPTPQELAATSVVRLPIAECVAKVRSGDPIDDREDMDSDVWAGVIPVQRLSSAAIPSSDLKPGIELPDYIAGFRYPGSSQGEAE